MERLLQEWKWLVQGSYRLLALNPFGDLFLEDPNGGVCRLDVTSAEFRRIADSKIDFTNAADESVKKKEWFLEDLAWLAEQKGCRPAKCQCIGYKIPVVFEESANMPDNLYVADLYEFVAFMGDVHGQMRDVRDGEKVRIKIQPKPDSVH